MNAKTQDLTNNIPFQETSVDIWASKYQLKTKAGEPVDREIEDTYKRVAESLASVETAKKRKAVHEDFVWALRNGA
ncbi:MAG: adenosylcobalamin-dependent ribonucleoside-diphosphate reductase, partial [Pseudomonadota bacterium]